MPGAAVTVIGKDEGALAKTEDIENYYGFPQPISGRQLVQNGIAQAKMFHEAVGVTGLTLTKLD